MMTDLVERVKQAQAAAIDGLRGEDNLPKAAIAIVLEEAAGPYFGMHETEVQGVKLTCRYVAPGMTMHDLRQIFEKAEAVCEPEDKFSANPGKWANSRGIKAVTEAILDAIRALGNKR
jgi:hypothetical protein